MDERLRPEDVPVVVVLMVCHDRRDETLRCLSALQGCTGNLDLQVVLVDDGSSDGTSEAVQFHFPGVRLVQGDGTLYWAGGMRLAQDRAWNQIRSADWVLLLNDDTILEPRALSRMIAAAASAHADIVVGRVVDPVTGEATYGGVNRVSEHRPLTFELAPPGSFADTMNANATLIAAQRFVALGGLSVGYAHGMADFDLGLRATRAGARILVTNEAVATCAHNPVEGTWRDARLGRRERWRRLTSPKGLPPGDWFRFCFRFGGVRAPVYAVLPYTRVLLGITDSGGISASDSAGH